MSTRYPRYRISGDTYSRAFQYGSLAHKEILHTRKGYERAFLAQGVSWQDATEQARSYTEAIQEHYPSAITEMTGIAEGSGLPFEDILTMNCRTEILWRVATDRVNSQTFSLPGECSSFALEPDRSATGNALVGQNWDWLDVLSDGVIVLEVEREDGPNYVTVVEAGLLAKTIINSAGVGVGINTLVTSTDGGLQGLPFHVLIRAIADAQQVSDVVEILSSTPRASSGNYIVAEESGAVLNIEVAPGGPEDVHPLIARNGAVVHTNHFVQAPIRGFDLAPAQMADSYVRYGRMVRNIEQHDEAPLSIEYLQSVLGDHSDAPNSVCCHPDSRSKRSAQWSTMMSIIIEPATRTFHIAEGIPCDSDWHLADYSNFLA